MTEPPPSVSPLGSPSETTDSALHSRSDQAANDPAMVDAFLRTQTPYLQGSITHADQKATFLIVIVGAAMGFMESRGLVSRCIRIVTGWTLQVHVFDIALLLAVLFLLGAIILAAWVVWPRFKKSANSLVSWAAIEDAYASPACYANAIMTLSSDLLLQVQLEHHHYRCSVCNQKWVSLRLAYVASFLGLGLGLAVLLRLPQTLPASSVLETSGSHATTKDRAASQESLSTRPGTAGAFLQIAQFGIVSLGLVFAVRQLRTLAKSLQLNTILGRRQMFLSIWEPVDEKAVEVMTLHAADHFNPNEYEEVYRDRPIYLKSYLLMKRKYFYLCLSSEFERALPDYLRGITWQWLRELSQYQEFRDIHERHKHYYPRFAPLVEKAIQRSDLVGYMADTESGGRFASEEVIAENLGRDIVMSSFLEKLKDTLGFALRRVREELSKEGTRRKRPH